MRKTSQQVVGKLAERDSRIIFVGSDLGPDVLPEFRERHPERYLMEGISEQHIVGMAAGLAMEGFRPYVTTFSTFLSRRALEQICIDVCLHSLPVRFLAFGGGVAHASLGPTHCAVDDFALLRPIPNITILAPCDAQEAAALVEQSVDIDGPVYIRLARGGDQIVSTPNPSIGTLVPFGIDQSDVVIVSCGVMTQRALDAAAELNRLGVSARVLHAHTLKPFDDNGLVSHVTDAQLVITLEEHVRIGGLGSAVIETLADARVTTPVVRMGFPDAFVSGYGTQEFLLSKYGLERDDIVNTALASLNSALAITGGKS